MANISNEELDQLREHQSSHCVSIYLPYSETTGSANPNRIQLKNVLKRAERLLKDHGISTDAVAAMLRRPKELLDNGEFWPMTHDGLALFIAPDYFRYFHTPADGLQEALYIGSHFNIRPLQAITKTDKQYFVLALSHKSIRLYMGGHSGLQALELPKLAGGMTETLGIDEFPKSRELHPVGSAAFYGKGSEGYHQQYDVSQTDKTMLVDYFRRVDGYLHPFLRRYTYPLILAGTTYLLPLYRQVSTYPYLLVHEIAGNVERTNLATLHNKAMQALTPPQEFTPTRKRAAIAARFT